MSSTLTSPELTQSSPTPEKPALDPFDTQAHFERWLAEVNPEMSFAPDSAGVPSADSGILIGSFPGSNCEVSFEGVLHFDGYSIGNITSPDGTLVLTKRGRIEADIDVGVAVIGGSVTGDITASEQVVLESEARVTGQIRTPALSVRLGAVFDGDCLFTPPKIIPKPSEPIAPGAVAAFWPQSNRRWCLSRRIASPQRHIPAPDYNYIASLDSEWFV